MRLPERSSRALRAVRLANEGMQQTRSALTTVAAALAADPQCWPDDSMVTGDDGQSRPALRSTT